MQRQSTLSPAVRPALNFLFRAVATAAVSLAVTGAHGAPGQLDSSFNGNGLVSDPFQSGISEAFAVTVQTDGKIVVAGEYNNHLALARYNDDGSLDTTFNGDSVITPAGTVSLSIGATSTSEARAVTVGDGGTIVVAGEAQGTYRNLAVARFTSDGLPDTANFNSGSSEYHGANVIPIGTGDSVANAVAVQTNGYIVTAGYAMNATDQEFALARFTSGGDLDSDSFNVNGDTPGTVTTIVGSTVSAAQALAIQPDGRIVAAGTSSGGPQSTVAMARYNADGTLDTSFGAGGNGTVTTAIGETNSSAYGLTLDHDGKIIVAGQADNGTAKGFALGRYNTDGTLDNTFGTNGSVITPIGSAAARAEAVAIQPDGKIVAAGFATDGNNQQVLAVARYNDNGTLDTGFNSNGTVMTPIGTGNALGHAVALQTDAKIVVAGKVDSTSRNAYVMGAARYLAADTAWDLTPDPFHFDDVKRAVTPNTVQTSNLITITGLGQDIHVPVTVSDGEYAKGGSAAYTVNVGWAANGDQFNVRHTSVPGQLNTTLTVGGMISANNPRIVSGQTTADAFSSTSVNILGGSGSLAWLSLAALALALAWSARRRFGPW